MNTQPEALRLADVLVSNAGTLLIYRKEAAAELRCLYALNDDLYKQGVALIARISTLEATNQELLEALKLAVDALGRSDYIMMDGDSFDVVDVARAAIVKAGGRA